MFFLSPASWEVRDLHWRCFRNQSLPSWLSQLCLLACGSGLHSQIYGRGRGQHVHTGTGAKSPWASYMLRSWAAWLLPRERPTAMGRVSILPKCPWGSELPEWWGQGRGLSHLTRSQVRPQCSEDSGLPARDADLTSQPPMRPWGQGAEDSGSVLWLGLTTAQGPLFLPTSSDTHPILAVDLSPTSSHSHSGDPSFPLSSTADPGRFAEPGVFQGLGARLPLPTEASLSLAVLRDKPKTVYGPGSHSVTDAQP